MTSKATNSTTVKKTSPKEVKEQTEIPPQKDPIEERIHMSTENFFITGPGGTGKTWLVKSLEKTWKKIDTKYVLLTPTGVAAVNIGGQTIHRFFSIGLANGTKEQLLIRCRKMGGYNKIMPLQIIVIDEISMVSSELLDIIDYICQQIRKCPEPFGGIRMIFTGDFCQLKCVQGTFCFSSSLWKELKLQVIQLDQPKRFNDLSYWKMLNRARVGQLKLKDIERLNQRVEAYAKLTPSKKPSGTSSDSTSIKIEPTILLSYKAEVFEMNNNKLQELPGTAYVFKAQDFVTRECNEMLDMMAPKIVTLKIGAQVMCTRNIDTDSGICNGSRGVVINCTIDTVKVLFKNDIVLDITVQTWELEGQGFTARRMQIPLILAYALTIHRVQGLTLDCAVLDLGSSIFTPAQAYVALSRVRNYESLFLSDFAVKSIYANKLAVDYYDTI